MGIKDLFTAIRTVNQVKSFVQDNEAKIEQTKQLVEKAKQAVSIIEGFKDEFTKFVSDCKDLVTKLKATIGG